MANIGRLKQIYRRIVPAFLRQGIGCIRESIRLGRSARREYYYGQYGEDVLLRHSCMKSDYKGFYVDIGAFHPEIISNTQWFYEHGWRGINIDANPHSIILFNKKRKRDINILSGVSDKDGEMNYYYYWNETASRNTFDEELYKKWSDGGMKLKEIKKIKVKTINEILDKYLLEGQRIDFVTIDVEGFEMKILSTYNFKKYAPTYFLIEDLVYEDEDIDFMTFSGRPLYNAEFFLKCEFYGEKTS